QKFDALDKADSRLGNAADQFRSYLMTSFGHSIKGMRRITRLHESVRIWRPRGLPAGVLAPDLGLQVTGFAAGTAVVNAVFAQADFIEALAQRAIPVAGAASFGLVADHAHEFLGHSGRLSRFGFSGNGPMVDGLAVEGYRGCGMQSERN
ncbi:MAG: hypothetical protein ACXVJU_17655, partial [Candidatus Angelobacter sp.]